MSNSKNYQPEESQKISEGVYKTKINGLYYLPHNLFPDDRGFFSEISHIHKVEEIIKSPFKIAQINHSRSLDHVVRGMHTEGWRKLIAVVNGVVFTALADVRPNSDTFLEVETFILGPSDKALQGSLFIEAGIANSVCVLEGPVDYLYAVDKLYKDRDPAGDQAISIFDPDLNIPWPLEKDKMIISDRDKKAITLREKFPNKFS